MSDQLELAKYFTKSQAEDIVKLQSLCEVGHKVSRKPRVRKVNPYHIPRPSNSFLLFRQDKQSIIRKFCPHANHSEISKIVARWWRDADNEEKQVYITKAISEKLEHAKKYPGYVYRPKHKGTKKAETAETSNEEASNTVSSAKESPLAPSLENMRTFNSDGQSSTRQANHNIENGSNQEGNTVNYVVINNYIPTTYVQVLPTLVGTYVFGASRFGPSPTQNSSRVFSRSTHYNHYQE